MICKKCGTRFLDGMFCPECGSRTMPVSGSGAGQMNTWEAAFEYSYGEEYNTKMYGPQGQLEEQQITATIEINAGGKRSFENKKLVFKDSIRVGSNAIVEFRNCALIVNESSINAIRTGENVKISFENCVIKTKGKLILGELNSFERRENDKETMVKFANCAFVSDIYAFLNLYGSAYFENCFINAKSIAYLNGWRMQQSQEQTLEFRNCIMTNDRGGLGLIKAEIETTVILENCFIKSNARLIGKDSCNTKLRIKNCFFDNYSCMFNVDMNKKLFC